MTLIERIFMVWIGFIFFISGGHYFTPLPYIYIFLVSGLLISLVYFLKNRPIFAIRQRKIVFWALLLFITLLFLGIPFSPAPEYGLIKTNFFSAYALIFLFSAPFITRWYIYFGRVNVIFSIIFLGFMIYYFKDPISFLKNMAIVNSRLGQLNDESNIINPIWLARYLGYAFLTVVVFVKPRNLFYHLVKILLLITLAIYLLCCASRGPILALMISLIIFILNFKKFKTYQTIFITLLIGVGIILIFNIQSNEFLVSRFTFSQDKNSSVDIRWEIYGEIVKNISNWNFFWGHGTGAAGFLLTGGDERMYPHNLVLELLYENGFIGVFFFFIVIVHCCTLLKFRFITTQMKFWLMVTLYFIINSIFSGDLMSNQFILFGYFNVLCHIYVVNNGKYKVYGSRLSNFSTASLNTT